MSKKYEQIYKQIRKYDEIVIARHIGPDPDAMASQMALKESIKLTFPHKKVFAVGAGVSKYKYYGALDKVILSELQNPLLIMLDLPAINRLDGIDGNYFKNIIKIDHHPFEEKNGQIEWIEEEASSTCQMIIELILGTKLLLTKKIAEKLYLGMVSDSERFLFTNKSPKCFALAAKLIEECALDVYPLYQKLYRRPLREFRFQGYLMENLQILESGLAYIKIDDETLNKFEVDTSAPSNMINSFNYVDEILVWIFITQDVKNNLYKINIRSRGPIINTVASKHNGGGHNYASGCRIYSLEEVNKLLEDLNAVCLKYKEENENREI